jgi:hypothetical protein
MAQVELTSAYQIVRINALFNHYCDCSINLNVFRSWNPDVGNQMCGNVLVTALLVIWISMAYHILFLVRAVQVL